MSGVWEQLAAGDVGTFRGGSGFPVRFQGRQSGDLPFFKVSDMNSPGNELFMRMSKNYITEAQRKRLGAGRIPAGAIVFAKVGAAVFLERKRILVQDSCIDNNMAAFIVNDDRLDVRFAHYLLLAYKMSSLVATTALPSLNGEQLRSIQLLIPKALEEQRRIAAALSDVDDLVAVLGRRIAKKAAIKQGVMQQLLTGKIRLSGFNEPWFTTTLGALGTFLKGRSVKRGDARSMGIRCIRYGELYTAFDNYATDAKSFVSPEVAATALPLRTGDVLFAGSGETRDEIGKCIAYIGPTPAVAGGDVIVLRSDQCNPIYLALLANTPDVVRQKARAGQGDAVVHIYSHGLAAVEVTLPPRAEQNAITQSILDVDREIDLLRKRLRKAKEVRHGMMQQLLRGHNGPIAEVAV